MNKAERQRRDVAIFERLGVTQERVVRGVAEIAFADPGPIISGDDKMAALSMLARFELPYREDEPDAEVTRDRVIKEIARVATYDIFDVGESRGSDE